MIQLRTDEHFALRDLSMFIEPVELQDPQGKIIGVFVPANLERGQELYARAREQFKHTKPSEPPPRREDCKTTAEVFEHLLTLTQDPVERERLQANVRRLREDQ